MCHSTPELQVCKFGGALLARFAAAGATHIGISSADSSEFTGVTPAIPAATLPIAESAHSPHGGTYNSANARCTR